MSVQIKCVPCSIEFYGKHLEQVKAVSDEHNGRVHPNRLGLTEPQVTPDPIEVLRALAEYRAEYSGRECALQASTLRHAADILEGKGDAWGILPSWRWDEFAARFPTLRVVPTGEVL